MDKIDERYKRGKIYTVRCRYDDNLIYVGSTIQELCVRMAGHRRAKSCSLYQYVNGDWDNWYIELYEEYSCDNKDILEKREGEITRQIGTVNKRIAGRTQKEWYEDNVDKIAEYRKEYRQNNRDKIAEQQKQYNQDNADKIAEYQKEWYEANRDEILEQQKQYRKANRDKILQNNKQYRENNRDKIAEKYQNNKDKILEQKKQYYKDNVDKILEQRNQYQQDNADKISKYRKEKIVCDKCKSIVCRGDISIHKKTKKCLNYNVNIN